LCRAALDHCHAEKGDIKPFRTQSYKRLDSLEIGIYNTWIHCQCNMFARCPEERLLVEQF
jgi:hypothetical protein